MDQPKQHTRLASASVWIASRRREEFSHWKTYKTNERTALQQSVPSHRIINATCTWSDSNLWESPIRSSSRALQCWRGSNKFVLRHLITFNYSNWESGDDAPTDSAKKYMTFKKQLKFIGLCVGLSPIRFSHLFIKSYSRDCKSQWSTSEIN